MAKDKGETDGYLFGIEPSLLAQMPSTDPAILEKNLQQRALHNHYSSIGYVASQWAHLEAEIDWWLWTIAEIEPETGACFTSQMFGARPRADAFIALVKHLSISEEKWEKALAKFAKDVMSLGEQRNRAVHDIWDMGDPFNPQRVEVSARKKLRYLSISEPTEKLITLAQHIGELTRRFDEEIAGPIDDELRALRDKLPQ